ncbi:MAG: SH3 domain-containing protein [Alphaproteobacteria bacterium]
MKLVVGALTAAAAITGAAPALAYTNAMTTTAVNMRTGPDVAYPPVIILPPNAPIVVYGCIDGWSWCDASWGPNRGWVAGAYLAAYWQNRPTPWAYAAPRYNVPVVAFQFGPYWDSYYRGRGWYRQRGYWNRWDYRNRRWHR